jgi:hypothetical protein
MGDQRCESLRRERTCTIAPERLTMGELRPDSAAGKSPGMFDPGESAEINGPRARNQWYLRTLPQDRAGGRTREQR